MWPCPGMKRVGCIPGRPVESRCRVEKNSDESEFVELPVRRGEDEDLLDWLKTSALSSNT